MRLAVIVLIVIAVVFAVVAVQGGLRGRSGSVDASAPPTKNGEIDKDALSSWKSPKLANLIAKVSEPFAPRLKLANPKIVLPAGGTDMRGIPAYKPRFGSDTRVARIELQSGSGLQISYACLALENRQCPQTVCICTPGAAWTAMQISTCPEQWRNKRMSGAACTKDDGHASLIIYPEPGSLAFAALGPVAVTAEVK